MSCFLPANKLWGFLFKRKLPLLGGKKKPKKKRGKKKEKKDENNPAPFHLGDKSLSVLRPCALDYCFDTVSRCSRSAPGLRSQLECLDTVLNQ